MATRHGLITINNTKCFEKNFEEISQTLNSWFTSGVMNTPSEYVIEDLEKKSTKYFLASSDSVRFIQALPNWFVNRKALQYEKCK